MLFQMEVYNGLGYRNKGINSPYLWGYSNHYEKGKFIKDHVFDPDAVTQQIGTAVLLHRMREQQLFSDEESNDVVQQAPTPEAVTQIKQRGEIVTFDPNNFHAEAKQLQHLLNGVGEFLDEDGKAGRLTSDAYQHITGQFLKGDPKA